MTEEKQISYKVEEILRYVLFTKTEAILSTTTVPENAVMVEGLSRMYGFNRARLEEKRQEILSMIDEIVTDQFFSETGGSFLALAIDRSGEQWTSFHKIMEAFFCMASGLKLAGFSLPYEVWSKLPDGIPYIWFRREAPPEPSKLILTH